ncbi:MAG: hypothetical protein LBJ95_03155 [Oscillospiraceae bacterium]|nr:hypothetical protein [Oscillospiraceae bacterium]
MYSYKEWRKSPKTPRAKAGIHNSYQTGHGAQNLQKQRYSKTNIADGSSTQNALRPQRVDPKNSRRYNNRRLDYLPAAINEKLLQNTRYVRTDICNIVQKYS